VNLSANDRTITRFGWKAQNKSLHMFSGEAYNVEVGISNQLFPQERDETPSCLFIPTPNDNINFRTTPSTISSGISNPAVISDLEAFANFMRMLAPPTPAPHTSERKGTPNLCPDRVENLYSDLLVHHMGKGLADGITQGGAGPNDFRTATTVLLHFPSYRF
jgi:CxxC motif-containing protein (DUF1111 family)